MNIIVVKIADYKVISGSAALVTYGLGSCLAVSIYDPSSKTAGLAHIMLPNCDMSGKHRNPKKFADVCLTEMLEEMKFRGCNIARMVAKIAGGASMFEIPSIEGLGIGQRNRKSVLAELEKKGIPVIGEDTGGKHGRTVEFHLDSGEMLIKSLRLGIKVI